MMDLETEFEVKKPLEIGIDYEDIGSFNELLRLHRGRTALEQKFDGYGIIIDNTEESKFFSLDKNEWDASRFPEVTRSLTKSKRFKAIGEIVGRPTHKGFTNIEEFKAARTRVKNDYTSELGEQFPLDLQIYHLLELEGEDTRSLDLPAMRRALETVVKGLENVYMVEQQIVTDPYQYQDIVLARFKSKLEGSIAKAVDASYLDKALEKSKNKTEGLRNTNWIKLKCNINVDAVVLGTYLTDKCAQKGLPCSGILVGAPNGNKYETLVKVPLTGRENCTQVVNQLNLTPVKSVDELFHQEKVVYNPEIRRHKDKIPQFIVRDPSKSIVVEISAMEVSRAENYQSCGLKDGFAYTLRQGVFSRIRDDKTPDKATTTNQVISMYKG